MCSTLLEATGLYVQPRQSFHYGICCRCNNVLVLHELQIRGQADGPVVVAK